jgi:hypothetical protein
VALEGGRLQIREGSGDGERDDGECFFLIDFSTVSRFAREKIFVLFYQQMTSLPSENFLFSLCFAYHLKICQIFLQGGGRDDDMELKPFTIPYTHPKNKNI